MLRTLMLTTGLAAGLVTFSGAIIAGPVRAEDPMPGFAPGATGSIGVDVTGLMDKAAKDAEALKDKLMTAAPHDLGELTDSVKAIETHAMNDPRLRELLGVTGETAVEGDDKPGYGEARVLVFASFAMPGPSLAQVLRDAERFHAVVVFRGFLDNSVIKTGDALRAALGDGEIPKGFAIDPTLFTRFGVKAVPAYVVLKGPLATCETEDCLQDALPAHDRLSGNIPLETALSLVAAEQGDAADTAKAVLAEAAAGAVGAPITGLSSSASDPAADELGTTSHANAESGGTSP